MALSPSQCAMIYLVAKRLKQNDFCEAMAIKKQRGSQMLNWRNPPHGWSKKNKEKVREVTNGGLDVDHEIWQKVAKLLESLPSPTLPSPSP